MLRVTPASASWCPLWTGRRPLNGLPGEEDDRLQASISEYRRLSRAVIGQSVVATCGQVPGAFVGWRRLGAGQAVRFGRRCESEVAGRERGGQWARGRVVVIGRIVVIGQPVAQHGGEAVGVLDMGLQVYALA
jgi:hypothetical protein